HQEIIFQYPDTSINLESKGIKVSAPILHTDWQLTQYYPYQHITGEISKVFGLYAIYLIVNILFFLIISIFISRSLYTPLNRLRNTAEKFGDGDLSIRFPVTGNDEIAVLGKAFNHMLDRLNRLIGRIKQEQKEKREIELQALFAQI